MQGLFLGIILRCLTGWWLADRQSKDSLRVRAMGGAFEEIENGGWLLPINGGLCVTTLDIIDQYVLLPMDFAISSCRVSSF